MSDFKARAEMPKPADKAVGATAPGKKPVWETPKMEDVSQQVMAQPYIRFT